MLLSNTTETTEERFNKYWGKRSLLDRNYIPHQWVSHLIDW